MKISIIVPVYNTEDYLLACIDSVLKQTYSDYELILMDDGSTDGSAAICDKYCKQYSDCIRAVHLQNGGPLRARLLGIKEVTGDVVVFLDSDDCLREDALEKIAACFLKNDCDIVLYDTEECAEFPTIRVEHPLKDGAIFEEESKKDLYRKIIFGEISNSIWSKAVRRECAAFPERFMNYTARHGEDLLMSACFITNAKKVVYLKEGLYRYRNRPGSAIHSFNFQRKESLKTVHNELAGFIDVWQMPELKLVHNSRKVRGGVDNLKLLLKNKKSMPKSDFKRELASMAEDPYFRTAYENMDGSHLSKNDFTLARLLYKRRYLSLSILLMGNNILKKLK